MLEGLSLLYVEDDKSMQEYMKELFEGEIKEFYQAFDGEEGLEIYKDKKPDLILSDINMPKMDGFEMSKEIKNIDHEQVIIFFTVLNDIDEIKKAIDININGFISKPLSDVEELFSYIESKLDILKVRTLKKELNKTKEEKEKLDFVLQTIQEITHHWRQPLSTIAMHASNFSFKYRNSIEFTHADFNNTEIIVEQINKLSSVLEHIESIKHDKNIDMDSVMDLIKISNPIYE